MSAFLRYLPAAAELWPWTLDLTIWLAARILNLPAPLVQAVGIFVLLRLKRRLFVLLGRT